MEHHVAHPRLLPSVLRHAAAAQGQHLGQPGDRLGQQQALADDAEAARPLGDQEIAVGRERHRERVHEPGNDGFDPEVVKGGLDKGCGGRLRAGRGQRREDEDRRDERQGSTPIAGSGGKGHRFEEFYYCARGFATPSIRASRVRACTSRDLQQNSRMNRRQFVGGVALGGGGRAGQSIRMRARRESRQRRAPGRAGLRNLRAPRGHRGQPAGGHALGQADRSFDHRAVPRAHRGPQPEGPGAAGHHRDQPGRAPRLPTSSTPSARPASCAARCMASPLP